jgi:hypothetical protein
VDSKESVPPQSGGQPSGKKAYRKPSVQVYGTLSEMTQAVNGDAGHPKDNGNNVAGSPVHNRT